jgi:hypothetical protein
VGTEAAFTSVPAQSNFKPQSWQFKLQRKEVASAVQTMIEKTFS